ncbi:hypothetical protein M3672_13880 [Microbacterium enclense]|uniref:alpha/beta fold hydrolase n=1 Tax=Microbacterium enclense TaxID=993073 RepID=UPI00203CE806|nr:hypothetical protein [Microbacterium enclense]MCM3615524.1 hypothetical protein [Microbacterium enclense]
MTVLLFVHGTSVRELRHDDTIAIITRQVSGLGRGWDVETCYWGTAFGATPGAGGATVPGYPTRQAGDDPQAKILALWSVLYTDPFYELRVLKFKPTPPQPFGMPPSHALLQAIRAFTPSADTVELFASFGLADLLHDALGSVAASRALEDAAATATPDAVEHRQAIARAIVAHTLATAQDAGVPALSGWMRDRLVGALATDLRADVLGLSDWLTKSVGSLLARVTTPALLANRASLTDATTPAVGDILRFLARPHPVEEYLNDRIASLEDRDVYLLGHSLGGIICVDLLARTVPPNVRGLITAGSQAPYLYEIGALPSLPTGAPLPRAMPPWLNIYDPHDMLAYVGAGVFGDRVRDVAVNSGQPFPQAHTAYWNSPDVWASIAEFANHER